MLSLPLRARKQRSLAAAVIAWLLVVLTIALNFAESCDSREVCSIRIAVLLPSAIAGVSPILLILAILWIKRGQPAQITQKSQLGNRYSRDQIVDLSIGPRCPDCGNRTNLRNARAGSYFGSYFWGCSKYPECKRVVAVKIVAVDLTDIYHGDSA